MKIAMFLPLFCCKTISGEKDKIYFNWKHFYVCHFCSQRHIKKKNKKSSWNFLSEWVSFLILFSSEINTLPFHININSVLSLRNFIELFAFGLHCFFFFSLFHFVVVVLLFLFFCIGLQVVQWGKVKIFCHSIYNTHHKTR